MGASLSQEEDNLDQNQAHYVASWKYIFTDNVIKKLFKEISNQDINTNLNSPVDSVLVSSLIENLISFPKYNGNKIDFTAIERQFLNPIIHDIDIHIDQARMFTKCFEGLKTNASNLLDKEQTTVNALNERITSKFSYFSQIKKTTTDYLENLITLGFNELLNNVDLLEVSDVLKHLKYLNTILHSEKEMSLSFVNASSITSIQKFMTKLGQFEKFRIKEIQKQVVQFLINLGNVQGSITGELASIIYSMSLPLDFNGDFGIETIGNFGSKTEISNNKVFELKIQKNGKIISFSIGGNVLALIENIGLIHFIEPEPIYIPIDVANDSILLDVVDFIYIFSISLGTITYFQKGRINEECIFSLDLSKYINIKHKILAVGNIDKKVAILQKYSKTKYRISFFDENLSSNHKRICALKFSTNSPPRLFFFNGNVLHIFYENMFDHPLQISNDLSNLINLPELYCNSVLTNSTPIACFKGVIYTLTQNNKTLYFIKNEVTPSLLLKDKPYTYTNCILPVSEKSTLIDSLIKTTNRFNTILNDQLKNCIENPFSVSTKSLTFFLTNDNSAIELSISMIQEIDVNDLFEVDVKMGFVSFGLKIIAINLFSYCSKFNNKMKNLTKIDFELFGRIQKTMKLVIASNYSERSPLIIESICTILYFSSKYLFYPDYSRISELSNLIWQRNTLRNYFISNLPLLCQSFCSFYIFSKNIFTLLNTTVTDKNKITQLFSTSLDELNLTLQFLIENSIKTNEEFMVPYFECLFLYIFENFDCSNEIIPLLQKIIFRVMLLNTFPLISLSIIENSFPLIEKLNVILNKKSNFRNDDVKYSNPNKYNYSMEEKTQIIESKHNYDDNFNSTEIVEFPGYEHIYLYFDPMCHTEKGCDILTLIDGNTEQTITKLSGSVNNGEWPNEYDVNTNKLIFKFSSDTSVNFWGYKVTCSARAVKAHIDFNPDDDLFFYNIFFCVLGNLTNIALKSLPLSRTETQCKLILDSGLLKDAANIYVNNDNNSPSASPSSLSVSSHAKTIFNSPLSKNIRGISFDATNCGNQYSDEMKKCFMDDIVSNNPLPNGIAESLFQFMYKSVRNVHRIKPNPSILKAEKYAIAALLKQLGFLNLAISFAIGLSDSSSKHDVVPPNLNITWKAIYKLRTTLYKSYQKTKVRVEKNEQPKSLNENFEAFVQEVIIKSKYLMYADPLLKRRFNEKANYDPSSIEKTVDELISFLSSNLLMVNLSRMVEQQTRRMEIRLHAMSFLIKMIDNSKTYYTTQLSFFDPLRSSLQDISDQSDVKSVKTEMHEEMTLKFSKIFELLISRIVDKKESCFTRMMFIQMIAVSISDIIPYQKLLPSYFSLVKYIMNYLVDSIESFITFSCLWRFIGLWTIEYSSQEIFDFLLNLVATNKQEFCKNNAILLLSYLTQNGDYQNTSFSNIVSCFHHTSPRVIIATLNWLSNTLVRKGSDGFDVEINNQKFNFEQFVYFLLKAIGSSFYGHGCLIIEDKSNFESHLVVAEEMVAFLRLSIKQHSKVQNTVIKIFHQIFSNVMENSQFIEYIDNYEITAIFITLGKEISSFHNSGYVIQHEKANTKYVRISSYEPVSGNMRTLDDNFIENTFYDKQLIRVPSIRISANPNDFLINVDEAGFFINIQKEINKMIDDFPSPEYSIFASSFIGFLTISLQNAQNMEVLIQNIQLSNLIPFLDCAAKQTNRNKNRHLECLMNKISQAIIKIANIKNTFKIHEKKLPYSLIFNDDSPQVFLPLIRGTCENNYRIVSNSDPLNIFVGDKVISNKSLFYFEIKICSKSNNDISIGLFDKQTTTFKSDFYGLSLLNSLVSPLTRPKHNNKLTINEGDIIGCGYTRDQIIFFVNGETVNKSLQLPPIDNFVPVIITSQCSAILEYNFGHKMFITDIAKHKEFNLAFDCLEHFKVTVPTQPHAKPTTYMFDDEEYDKFIQSGSAFWEVPKSRINDSKSKLTTFQDTNNAIKNDDNSQHEFIDLHENLLGESFFIGEPVYIARRVLSKSQSQDSAFDNLPLNAQINVNKYGIVTNVETIPRQDYFNVTVETFDPALNAKTQFIIDSRFIDSIEISFIKLVESASYTLLQSNNKNMLTAIAPTIINKNQNKLYSYAKEYIIRMSRILSLIFTDFFRLKNKLDIFFCQSQINEIFNLNFYEVFKFIHTPKVSKKWNIIRPTDFIFTNNHQKDENVMYICPCNTHNFTRFIRALIYTYPKIIEPVLSNILQNAISHISQSPYSTREDMFNLVPNRFIYESIHPVQSFDLSTDILLPRSSTGFIPVIHPKTSQNITIKLSDYSIKDPVSDCTLFLPTDSFLQIISNFTCKSYGFKVCFLPITEYLSEPLIKSSLGGIHLIFTILSIVLSSKETFPSVEDFLKQQIIPGLTDLMENNNFLVNIFAFEIIAPILTSFKWDTKDITPCIEASFKSFTTNLNFDSWQPLPMSSQQAIAMSVFTRLLLLDISASKITAKSPPEEIAYLYDTYVKSKTNSNSPFFELIIEAISICTALGFNMPINVRFPAYLIAESWVESIPYCIDVYFHDDATIYETECVNDIKFPTIEFVDEPNIPSNYAIKVVNQLNRTFSHPEDDAIILESGSSCELQSPTRLILIDKFTGKQITHTDCKVHVTFNGYPESHKAKKETFIANYQLFTQHVNFMSAKWEVSMDESLCRICKVIPSIYTQFPLVTSQPIFLSETAISNIPAQLLRCRLQLFKKLEFYIPDIIQMVEFGNQESLLGCIFTSCRAAISTDFKLEYIRNIVMKNNQSGNSKVDLRLNRFKASLFHSNPQNPSGKSILDQFIDQVPSYLLYKMKREEVPWHVDLIGEGATDVGGPGRDLFTEVCMELMHPSLKLFIQNPNKRVNNANTNQELLIPNPSPLTQQRKRQYFYAGVLIAICYTSKLQEPFRFARFVWNYLTNKTVTIEDIYDVDLQFKQLMISIENCEDTISSPDQFSIIFSLYFQVQDSLGNVVELFPGGSNVLVTFDRRLEYVQRCKTFRMKEFNEQLKHLAKGFNSFFPATAAIILSPWELELIVCGDNQCPVKEMKKNCSYRADDKHAIMLWEVLEEFTPEERMLFIKFGCGRMGLPPPGMSWPSKLQIQFRSVVKIDAQKPLPTAATCNNMIIIPRYDSKEWMAKKIRTAITLGADIDQDRNANIQELQEFT
ncbi:hypothetical protein TRFO_03035 [Tritrichomonas foetus]|uniref:HECT domain-containing protein n=1 Tax=Tritrichomonas foetus TaxID=1144522 RepID=A0A1J4KV40_9EUKA|nr:hypothetical protein TRFO_03035 [Tritrichomonas foetus]|eukprot:OHT14760.1 hypothetical protein TRFO_03035 [Tritrichomonas foetus]